MTFLYYSQLYYFDKAKPYREDGTESHGSGEIVGLPCYIKQDNFDPTSLRPPGYL